MDRETLVLLMKVNQGINGVADICEQLMGKKMFGEGNCVMDDLFNLSAALKKLLHIGDDDASADFFYSLLDDHNMSPEDKADKLIAWCEKNV